MIQKADDRAVLEPNEEPLDGQDEAARLGKLAAETPSPRKYVEMDEFSTEMIVRIFGNLSPREEAMVNAFYEMSARNHDAAERLEMQFKANFTERIMTNNYQDQDIHTFDMITLGLWAGYDQ